MSTTYKLQSGVKASDFREGSHARAVVAALATGITNAKSAAAFVEKKGLLKESKMPPAKAVAWVLSNLASQGKVIATKVEKKAKAKKAAKTEAA